MQFAINLEYSGCVRGKRRKLTINTSAGTFPSQGQCSDLTMETFSPCWQCSVPSPQCSKCPLGCCNQHVSQHRCRPHPTTHPNQLHQDLTWLPRHHCGRGGRSGQGCTGCQRSEGWRGDFERHPVCLGSQVCSRERTTITRAPYYKP